MGGKKDSPKEEGGEERGKEDHGRQRTRGEGQRGSTHRARLSPGPPPMFTFSVPLHLTCEFYLLIDLRLMRRQSCDIWHPCFLYFLSMSEPKFFPVLHPFTFQCFELFLTIAQSTWSESCLFGLIRFSFLVFAREPSVLSTPPNYQKIWRFVAQTFQKTKTFLHPFIHLKNLDSETSVKKNLNWSNKWFVIQTFEQKFISSESLGLVHGSFFEQR